MSGGHFDYVQYRITTAAEQVAELIREVENAVEDEYGYKREYEPETVEKFRECETLLKKAAVLLHRVDWLVSGDDGEDDFHRRLKEDLEVVALWGKEGLEP